MALRHPSARRWLVLVLALAGCGDDGVAPPPNNVPVPQPQVTPKPGSPKGQLAVKPHVEDRVLCTPPDQPSDPKGGQCDPKAPSCGEHLYCLQLAQGFYCEPCPERDGIRHAFRERDFDAEHNRDPFQRDSLQPLTGSGGPKPQPGDKCRADQLVASSYSYADLKLVGIVAQGTQRKVLMTVGKDGFIIKRGDCVGKEKAVVKDIGLGYIRFQGESDEHEVELNPKQLQVNDPLPVPPRGPAAGSNSPGAPAEAPSGTAPGANPPPAPKKP
ncbi:MAG TPA: hypothetical protein VF516_42975 [Kofleriaceae bacterium]